MFYIFFVEESSKLLVGGRLSAVEAVALAAAWKSGKFA